MRKLIIIVQLLLCSSAYTQEENAQGEHKVVTDKKEEYQNFWKYGKEIGLNVTQLAGKFVPFNFTNKAGSDQLIALKTKWYGNKRALILNVGIDINTDEEVAQLFLSLGYERRRHISSRWKYTTGWEVFAGTLTPGQQVNGPLLGISKPYGLEYHFYDNFYISTEARLLAGIGADGGALKINYPNSIFFNMLIE